MKPPHASAVPPTTILPLPASERQERVVFGVAQREKSGPAGQPYVCTSVFLRQENRGRAAVRFRDDPDFPSAGKGVSREEPEPVDETEFVLATVVLVHVSPVSCDVSDQIGHGIVSGCL